MLPFPVGDINVFSFTKRDSRDEHMPASSLAAPVDIRWLRKLRRLCDPWSSSFALESNGFLDSRASERTSMPEAHAPPSNLFPQVTALSSVALASSHEAARPGGSYEFQRFSPSKGLASPSADRPAAPSFAMIPNYTMRLNISQGKTSSCEGRVKASLFIISWLLA